MATGTRTFVTTTAAETRALGAALGRVLAPGTLVLLQGALGAGKTTLAQGVAAGMGVSGPVTSPSFTLVREYETAGGAPRLAHMDFYRLSGAGEVRDVALEDHLAGDEVVLVEWPERGGELVAEEMVHVSIAFHGAGRRWVLAARGRRAEAALAALAPPAGLEVR